MTLTVRSATVTDATTKGSALTHAELDENFNHLRQSSNHSFTQSGTGAVARTVSSKLQDTVSVFDFMTAAEIASVQAFGYPNVAAAVQAAWDTGKHVFHPYGGYGIGTKLTLSGAANHGQRLFGEGPSTNAGVGTKSTIFKPTSAVSVFAELDAATHIQHWKFEGFTVDMDSMTDASTSIAFNQKKAWGGVYERVTTINDGTSKRAWKFEAGAYTTTLIGCKGDVIQLLGTSANDAVTTLTFLNCDFEQMVAQYVMSINVFGGSVQGSRNKFDLADVNGFNTHGVDVEGTGTYLVIGSNVEHLYTANEVSAFSGTYSSGTLGSGMLMDITGDAAMTVTPASTGFRVNGQLLVTTTTKRTGLGSGNVTPALQVEANSATASASLISNRNDAFGPEFILGKSRGTTDGSATAVQASDQIGTIRFIAADGTDMASDVAMIRCLISTAAGSNDTPGALGFYTTADAQAAVSLALYIDHNRNVGIGTTTFGTNAAQVFSIETGTAPSAGVADTVQIYSSDNSAGNTIPSFYCEGTEVIATGQADSTSSVRVKMRINGTVVTLLAI
jgi:hypothetical protein